MLLESFTAGAWRALRQADLLARRQNAAVVEPLNLLAALVAEPENRAAELLVELGVGMEQLWAGLGVEKWESREGPWQGVLAIDEHDDKSLAEPLPVSPALRHILTDAMVRARGSDRTREVGTEHLLASLLSISGPAAELLRLAGLDLEILRERLADAVKVDLAPLPLAEGIRPLELSEPGLTADLGRIVDASANRAREGLRVVEDYVRFVLDDPGLTRRLKEIRHRLTEAERGLDEQSLLGSRDTHGDVGTHIMTPSERIRENPRAVLAANFKRIGEALRTLEEYSKLLDVWLAGRYEVLRYDMYTIEKLVMTAVAATRTLGDAALMVLVGGLKTLGDLTWVVGEALAGGADVIQYRDKGVPDRELLKRAREVRILTAQARVPLILNDRVDLARLASCDGVHIGQEDLSVRDARRIMGATANIGVSTHDREQLDAAILAGASYLGVGPVFSSHTKDFAERELAGLSFVGLASETTALPWFAIGGINEENLDCVLEAGATRIAVSSAVVRADSPRRAVQRLKARLAGCDGDRDENLTLEDLE